MAKGLSDRFMTGSYGRSTFSSPQVADLPHQMPLTWHDTMLAMGLAYVYGGATSDWADLTSTTLPVNGSTPFPASSSAFHRTYRFNDSLTGAAPIYLRGVPSRVGHQSYTTSTRTISLPVWAGVGDNGVTLALTNQDPGFGSMVLNNSTGDWSSPDMRFAYASGDGYAGVVIPQTDKYYMGHGGFIVERTTDAQGQPTDEGFAVMRLLKSPFLYLATTAVATGSDIAAFSYASKTWTIMNQQYMWVPVSASHNAGSYLNAYALHYQIDGKWFRMRSFVGVHMAEHVFGQPFELDTGGSDVYTFMPTGNPLYTPNPTAGTAYAGIGLAMRWE